MKDHKIYQAYEKRLGTQMTPDANNNDDDPIRGIA